MEIDLFSLYVSICFTISDHVMVPQRTFLSNFVLYTCIHVYTAISRKVVGKNVHATIPKGNLGYDQYTVPDTVAVKPNFVAFL